MFFFSLTYALMYNNSMNDADVEVAPVEDADDYVYDEEPESVEAETESSLFLPNTDDSAVIPSSVPTYHYQLLSPGVPSVPSIPYYISYPGYYYAHLPAYYNYFHKHPYYYY